MKAVVTDGGEFHSDPSGDVASGGHDVTVFDCFESLSTLDIETHRVERSWEATRGPDGDYGLVGGDKQYADVVTAVVDPTDDADADTPNPAASFGYGHSHTVTGNVSGFVGRYSHDRNRDGPLVVEN